MGAGRIPAYGRMARLALALAVCAAAALLSVAVGQAKTPLPDATFPKTIADVKYRCFEWGRPPKQFVIVCVPKKKAATKGAA